MTKLFVHNTLSRTKELFVPINGNSVHMFVCGQTPYDDAHIGHAKTYVNFAIISRWLRRAGFRVKYVQNITDIEDKIIKRAKEVRSTPKELESRYESRFLDDMQTLGISKDVDMYPRSHDYISAVREQIQQLLDKGYAYPLDGDVYFDVSKFEDYTKLSRMKIEELKKHRIEPRPGKRNVYDFSLWKAAKIGEPSWRIYVKYGKEDLVLEGRPGWHIEDTAMTAAIFGPQYDLHGGATELMFPHHTNEIAQAEAASGKKPFVKYWLHSGVLNIKGAKMSKSLKNFITIRGFLKKYDAEVLKLLICSTHYRKEIDYVESVTLEAQKRVRSLNSAFSIFYNISTDEKGDDGEVQKLIETLDEAFSEAMNDDFNTPLALGHLTRTVNLLRDFAESHVACNKEAKEVAVNTVVDLANVLGLLEGDRYKEKLPTEVHELLRKREQLRKESKYVEADLIRKELKEKYGFVVEDTPFGTIWYK